MGRKLSQMMLKLLVMSFVLCLMGSCSVDEKDLVDELEIRNMYMMTSPTTFLFCSFWSWQTVDWFDLSHVHS